VGHLAKLRDVRPNQITDWIALMRAINESRLAHPFTGGRILRDVLRIDCLDPG